MFRRTIQEVASWYEDQTRRSASQAMGRILKIIEYMIETDLDLDDLKIEIHPDVIWNERGPRNDDARRARIIGSSNFPKDSARKAERFWIMPKGAS